MRKSLTLAALLAATVAMPALAQEDRREGRGQRQERSAPAAQAPQRQEGGYRSPWVQNGASAAQPQRQYQPPQQVQQPQQARPPVVTGQRGQYSGSQANGGQFRGRQDRGDQANRGGNPWVPNAEWQARRQAEGRRIDPRASQFGGQAGIVRNDRRDDDRRDGNRNWNGNRDGNRNWNDRDGDRDRGRNWNGNNNGNRNYAWNQGRNWNGNSWSRDWRRDRRYDWQNYRYSNRGLFNQPYYAPYGWGRGYQRFSIGLTLGNSFYDQQYWLDDPYSYRLPPAYGPYRWVRYFDDVLLVDLRTGQVVDAIYDFFW